MDVIEISPPPVQSKFPVSETGGRSKADASIVAELHDAQMGEEAGRKLGMPLDAFTEEVYKALVAGRDQIVIGSVGPAEAFNDIIDKRRNAFTALAKMMRGGS